MPRPNLSCVTRSPGASAGTARLPTVVTPGRVAIRSEAGAEAAAAARASRRHSISDAGISDKNRDGVWKDGRPHQLRAAARVRYSRSFARVIPT